MGIKLNKKGQTEDIFGDLLLAFLLSIVGVVLLISTINGFTIQANQGLEDAASIDIKNDLISFLNTNLGSILGKEDLSKLVKIGLDEDSTVVDFFYIAAVYSDKLKESKEILVKIVNYFRVIYPHQYTSEASINFEFTPDYTLIFRFEKLGTFYFIRIINKGFSRSPPEVLREPTINIIESRNKDLFSVDDVSEAEWCLESSGFSGNKYFYRSYGHSSLKSKNYDGDITVDLHSCIIGRRFYE
ncbi:hypothetical protein HY498_02940 [Candidatus Woesearchaeota archaeon]|nr:hypothetical protein [Candidatus Woesearchaeota archaeon]